MLRFNLTLDIPYRDSDVVLAISEKAKVDTTSVLNYAIISRSIDARRKRTHGVKYSLTVLADIENEPAVAKRLGLSIESMPMTYRVAVPKTPRVDAHVVVVGAGPAGLFSALTLARSGVRVTLIERGERVEDRVKSIEEFISSGRLNPLSNIQFGEGGAGTFSDGKLTTGIKNPRISYVLDTLVSMGAPECIRYDSKAHIGTDLLRQVVKNIRIELLSLGVDIAYSTIVTDLIVEDGVARGVKYEREGVVGSIYADAVVLAIGHSARDTYYTLRDIGVSMEKKAFSIGVRIEHLRRDIDISQYGREDIVADYKLATHLPNGRGVYTFCMCPGGEVVPASSEEGMVVTNGMSYHSRDGLNSNSALLVSVTPDDFYSDDVLAGVEYQRHYERLAYEVSGTYAAPCQTVGSLLYGDTNVIGRVKPTYPLGVVMTDMYRVLPDYVVDSIKRGILEFDKRLRGFADRDAILTGVETRSSSPVRILRDETCQSNILALYPCGEGAGYAGGIMSASVDGVRVAEEVLGSEYI